MRQTLIALPLAAIAAVAIASLPASAETRSFSLSGFNEVSASAGVKVVLQQGPFSVTASEPDGRFDNLQLEVRGSKLVVGRKGSSSWFRRGPQYTVIISAPDYRAIEASSGSNVDGANLRLADISTNASSGANLTLSGSCNSITAGISSGASVSAQNLRCESARVTASSGGNAHVFASATASGNASSGGSVRVHGNPASLTKDTSSGGSVSSS